jgi:hypothetical protein
MPPISSENHTLPSLLFVALTPMLGQLLRSSLRRSLLPGHLHRSSDKRRYPRLPQQTRQGGDASPEIFATLG